MVFRFYFGGEVGYVALRDYMKNGSDFVKELSTLFGEWSDLESQYSKSLIKLATRLNSRAALLVGSMADSWSLFSGEMVKQAEMHQAYGQVIQNDTLKTLKNHLMARTKALKTLEFNVEKCSKNLKEFRHAEAKSKKTSFKENQECEALHHISQSGMDKKGKPLVEKELSKIEKSKSQLNAAVFKSDREYFDNCVKAEISREELEASIFTVCDEFQKLEIENIEQLRSVITESITSRSNFPTFYTNSFNLIADATFSINAFTDLKHISEQKGNNLYTSQFMLPDFFAEDIGNSMEESRRRLSLQNVTSYVTNDINREARNIDGMKRLSLTFSQSASKDEILTKITNAKSLILFLELTKFKVSSVLATVDKTTPPFFESSENIEKTKEKSGQIISIYKMPTKIYEEIFGRINDMALPAEATMNVPINHAALSHSSLVVRKMAPHAPVEKHVSNNVVPTIIPQTVIKNNGTYNVVDPSLGNNELDEFDNYSMVPIGRCTAIYNYEAKEADELNIFIGAELIIYNKQSDGWWFGELNGKLGLFPAAYVKVL